MSPYYPGGAGLARWPRNRARGTASSQPGIHRITQGSRQLLPGRVHDPHRAGQSLGAHLEGNASIPVHPTQPVPVCADATPWFLAEPCGDPVWKDGTDFSQAHPRPLLGRTPSPNLSRNRRDQRRTDRPSMEEIRAIVPNCSGYYLMKRYTSQW